MNQHLSISIDTPIKLVIGTFSFFNTDLVRHDEAWLGLAGNYKIAEIAVVGLDVALAGTE